MPIKVIVWGENVHEQNDEKVQNIYPDGMHNCIADGLNIDDDIDAKTVTLQEPEHGLSTELLNNTDVLIWWGHIAHDRVNDKIVDRVHARVLEGMGIIILHSAHYSKIFRKLLGTTCSLRWREAGELERIWVCDPGHKIAQGIDRFIELPQSEMYGEPFQIPPPDEIIFTSWFEGGETFRSGVTYKRGNGKLFYFSPGHETYPIYHQKPIKLILKNAVKWAYQENRVWLDNYTQSPSDPIETISSDKK
tara:strand:+ start:1026 stop:1769 length:744 start_codon:yes stop_codon:yes gene_type:complete